MPPQIKDPFFWNGKRFDLISAKNAYTLFDPKAFGLKPESVITSCRKGFVIWFEVIENQLYLKDLGINCEDNYYPPINGVEAVWEREEDIYHDYKNIDLPLSYSGTIIIGDKLKQKYVMRGFVNPDFYEHTYELSFQNGILTDSKDTTGQYPFPS